MNKAEINSKLAIVAGFTVQSIEDGKVFGYIKREGDNVLNVTGPIDFTKDLSLLTNLMFQYKVGYYHTVNGGYVITSPYEANTNIQVNNYQEFLDKLTEYLYNLLNKLGKFND